MIVTNTDIQNAIRTAKNAIYSLALSRVSSIEQGQEVCYEDYLLCEKMANYISVLERVDLGDENGCIVTEDVWNIISSIKGNSVLADLCLAIPNEFSNPGSSSSPVTGGCVTAVLGPLVDNSNPRRPFVSVAVDGTSITGTGAPGDPLVAVGGGGGATNLGYVASSTNGVVTSSTGTDATIPLADGTNAGLLKPAKFTVLENTSGTNTGNETAASIGAIVNGATNYTTPQDADKIGIWDVANSLFKALTWVNLKATLKTYFDTIYTTTAAVASQITTALSGYLTAATAASTYATIASQPRSIFMDAGDQSTTSNVATDITELVFSVEANKRYFIRGHIRVGCNNTGGVKIGAVVPAGATFYNAVGGRSATTTPSTVAIGAIITSGALSTATFIIANNAYGFIEIAGEFTIDATAGNVQFQFASGTNTQTSTVYQQGTQISVIELS